MRVILWILDLYGLLARIAIYDEDPTLVPNADAVAALRYDADLCHVFAFEDRVLSSFESLAVKRCEKHAVAAAECEFIGPLGLDYLVDIASEEFLLGKLYQLPGFGHF